MNLEPAIDVLLATFNGARFLRDQVDCILCQRGVRVRLLVRDDGSTDGTRELLHALAATHPDRLRVLPATAATGSATANFRLLLQSAGNATYVALADQDDVWQPDKLARSMDAMRGLERTSGHDAPLLVFTDLQVVEADLQPVTSSLWRSNGLDPANIHRLGRLLGENVVTGCTALLNRSLAALAARMPTPDGADPLGIQHDHWIALLACTLGHAAWLPQATVRYRQHGGNVVGAAAGGPVLRRLFGRAAVQARHHARQRLQQQAQAFRQTYAAELTPPHASVLRAFADLDAQPPAARLQRMIHHGFWRGTPAKNLIAILDLLRSAP